MRLPGGQDELIKEVAAVNPNTIVVLNMGSPVEMPWLEDIRGLIHVWYAGQEMGNALSDILFGEVNPSGKLPTSFPKSFVDNPAYINYPGENGKVLYGEGIFIGYRYYDIKNIEMLFPFGFGLSYTQFEYRDLELDKGHMTAGEEIKLDFGVVNIGDRPGMEVAQVYLREVKPHLARPKKELKGFIKVFCDPGEEKRLTLTINSDDLAYYDDRRNCWIAEAGEYEVLIGSSSRDIHLRSNFILEATDLFDFQAGRVNLHTGVRLSTFLDEEIGKSVIEKHLAHLFEHPQFEMALGMSLDQISMLAPEIITPDILDKINRDLVKLARKNGT